MKKIIIIIIGILFITGCQSEKLTPTSIVEAYLSKYQNLDKSVLKDLEMSLEDEKNMTEEQKKEYKSLIEKQYQNLSYKIKNEEIDIIITSPLKRAKETAEIINKKLNAEMDLDRRKQNLYQLIPRLEEIDNELNNFAINTAKNILNNSSL